MNLDEKNRKIVAETGALFHRAGEEIYLVGGAVRDMVAGIEPRDFDFVTGASQQRIMKIMRPASSACYDKSRAKGYGTTGVALKSGGEIEITPYRIADGVVATGSSLTDDLKSRDFTINAMAMDLSSENFLKVIDPCGGVEDFSNRILSTPAPVMVSFNDDPLRILRAARFAADFELTPRADLVAAVKQIASDRNMTGRVALERVREEIFKMLMQRKPSAGFSLMMEWGLMELWLPEVSALLGMEPEEGAHHKNVYDHTLKVLDRAALEGPADPVFRFAALLHDVGKPTSRTFSDGEYSFDGHDKAGAEIAGGICERLKLSNEQTEMVTELVGKHHRIHGYNSEWTDSAIRRAIHDLGGRHEEIIALARSDVTSSMEEKVEERLAMVDEFVGRIKNIELEHVLNPRPPVSGEDVMKMLGINPGPEVGKVIKFLKEKIISGELAPNDEDSARKIVISREWE